MIRTTVALFVFAVVICGLIIFRPFAGSDQITQDRLITPFEGSVEVTRSATPDISALAQAAVAAAPMPVDPGTGIVQAPRRVDVPRPSTDDTRLSDMTNNVLAELGFAGPEHVTTNSQAQRQSTSLLGSKPQPANAPFLMNVRP
jgi:hypothetical protein